MARTSKTMLNNSSDSGYPCLVPELRGDAFSFSPLKIMFTMGLSYVAFTMLRSLTTDSEEIQRIIRDYYEQLYGNKMDNLEEMDRFLEKFILPRLNQEEIKIVNNLITNAEIKTDQKSSRKQKPRAR